MIEHGRTGFLCSTAAEWADAASQLANQPELRASMGAAARRAVEERYGVARWASELARLIDRLSHSQYGTTPSASRLPSIVPEQAA
jgi:glycosyltransferase involved in cell wall biosynthesis